MDNFEYINVEQNKFITTLWLNRPQKHNALFPELMEEVIDFFHSVEDDQDCRVVVIRGNGISFCAGADLKWMSDAYSLSDEENLNESRLLSKFFSTIYKTSKVTIGIAHGNIFGGGNGLLAACDIAYGLDDAVFSLSETRLGLIAASISQYMLLKIKPSVYKELIFTARRFNGKEAAEIGLLNKSFHSQSELESHLKSTLESILKAGPKSLVGSKNIINQLLDPLHSDGIIENIPKLFAEVRLSSEAHEGFSAFLEKRKPHWF